MLNIYFLKLFGLYSCKNKLTDINFVQLTFRLIDSMIMATDSTIDLTQSYTLS